MASWENNRGGFWPTWQEHKIFTVLMVLLFVSLIALIGATAKKTVRELHQIGYSDHNAPTITVSATGNVEVTPDIATTDIVVMKQASTAAQAQSLASDAMSAVIADIKALGIAEKDLRTSSFETDQVYDYDVSPAVVTGYRSTQTLTVKIRDIALISSVLDGAPESGATSVSGIRYEVDDEVTAINDARDEAIADAMSQARVIAKSLGGRLGRVVNYSENQGGNTPRYFAFEESANTKAADSMSTVEVGQNTVEMTVYITYALY